MNLKLVFLCIFCVSFYSSSAQDHKEAPKKSNVFSRSYQSFFDEEDSLNKKDGFFILPLLYYTPDTRFAYGLAGVYYFSTAKSFGKDVHPTRLSYIRLLGDYTQN